MISQRDLRIDFFRGLALLIVLVDHIEGWSKNPLLSQWTLISLGFSDAAEIFVFLSGYVFAGAYSKTLDQDGLTGCFKKSAKRSLQIYVAYLLAAWTVIGIGALCAQFDPPYGDGLRIGDRAWESVLHSITLRFQPYGFAILAFYVILLPPMAVMLHLCRKAPPLAWLISADAYIVAQFDPNFTLSRFADGRGWYFNPLAWQFLFFIGLYLGSTPRRRFSIIPRMLAIFLSVTIIVLGVFAVKVMHVNQGFVDYSEPLHYPHLTLAVKSTLGPVRLTHFFALAYLVSQIFPPHLQFWSSRLAKPLIISGQQSLELYAFGLVFSFAAAIVLTRGSETSLTILVLDLSGCLALMLFAYWLNLWKRPRVDRDRV